jgi:hypothetical protein
VKWPPARYNRRMRGALVLALILGGCIPQGSGEQELRTRVPGTWVGSTPDGMKLTMHLAPDGTGEVNGHPGSWEIKIGRILLSDGEHLVPCDLDGDELSCHTPDGDLVLTREKPGEEVAAATTPTEKPAEPARPFTPEKTVTGLPFIAPANGPIGGASFIAPDGWSPGGGKVAGQDVHVLQSNDVASATITIGRASWKSVTDQPSAAVNRFVLDAQISSYTQSQHEVVLPSEDIEVMGQPAARTIFKHDVSEYYAAVVGGKDVIFVIVGRYPADQAEAMRPVVETVLASFRTSP